MAKLLLRSLAKGRRVSLIKAASDYNLNVIRTISTVDKSAVKTEAILKKEHGESTWYNELGSVMKFKQVENGQCSGLYCSAVGEAKKEYPFVGRYDQTRMGVIGWTVSWENQYMKSTHSVTTWSGQFQYDESIDDWVILTTWLLTQQTEPLDDWNSTNVGMDTFRPVEHVPEKIKEGKLRCQRSHPSSA